MIAHANLSPSHELNYLLRYTRGKPRELVENYLKRPYRDSGRAPEEVCNDLEHRFGSPAVVAASLRKSLDTSAGFTAQDNPRLQEFADLCINISAQIDKLPGLGSLNYPDVMPPILAKLSDFIRTKWTSRVH